MSTPRANARILFSTFRAARSRTAWCPLRAHAMDYGVVITDGNTLSVDMTETNRLRGAALAVAHHAGARE